MSGSRARALAAALLACGSAAMAQDRCAVPGEALHWVVDYCMMEMETDDEIAVSGCIERERAKRWRDACAGKLHYKRRMCEQMIRIGARAGTAAECVRDPAFQGSTVERGGVGG